MMENTAASGSEAVKRPIESSCDGKEEPTQDSDAKKIKTSTCDAAGDKVQSSKAGQSSININKSQSEKFPHSEAVVKSIKRLSDGTQSLSPSKKRKLVNTQGGSGEQLDKRKHSTDEIEKRKKRAKNKVLLIAILEQMEFYFSDSSLSKDRFLRKLYDQSEDGYIDLSVFNNFNKLQSLLKGEVSLNILCKALKSSKLLELSEDRTKVRRQTPLVELDQIEVDKRTVYVEHLPNHASHAWIKKIFSQCGRVCYVSLPVYQTSKEIKGFAFVEFGSAEDAEKACTMLNNPPPTKTEEKPGKFPKGNKFLYRAQKIAPSIKVEEHDSNEENLQQSDSKEDQVVSPTKKKKKKAAKKKLDESIEKTSITEPTESQNEKKKKKKKKKKQAPATEGVDLKEKDTIDETETLQGESGVKEEQKVKTSSKEVDVVTEKKNEEIEKFVEGNADNKAIKKKAKKKKRKKKSEPIATETITVEPINIELLPNAENKEQNNSNKDTSNNEVKLSRKERKRLRQEDIRRKKVERESKTKDEETKDEKIQTDPKDIVISKDVKTEEIKRRKRKRQESVVSESSETDDSSKIFRKMDGSQLTSCLAKSKKPEIVKKVEFDPVPITTEFVERKEIRRRKKQKRESLHLRVLSKKEWLSLRGEYISKQKSHMTALKESLRELRMQENANQPSRNNDKKHIDLTNVFGTKRVKPSQDVKLAHLEELKFIPNVIVQWKCSHEIKRNKIKTMFDENFSDSIAYIEGKEEAKSGYIRFKDEENAEEFARLCRSSDSFSARVLPMSQQAAYWEKANMDRVEKLSRKKNERGTDRIARKVFERNKATFHEKGSHVVFDEDDKNNDNNDKDKATGGNVDEDDSLEGFMS